MYGPVSCNYLQIYIYIRVHVLGLLVVSCLLGHRVVFPCASVSVRVRPRLPFPLFPFLTYSSVQDPGGPTLFSTHARNNATTLRFIQDLQPINKVTIRNAGIGPTIDEFAKAFAGRSIYSVGDLYSGYDQFQLAMESRDITTMRTPLGLVRMWGYLPFICHTQRG